MIANASESILSLKRGRETVD